MIQHVTRQIPPSQLDRCVELFELLGFEPVPVPVPPYVRDPAGNLVELMAWAPRGGGPHAATDTVPPA